MINNLISNVTKYAPGKSFTIYLKKELNKALLKITDQGNGITASDQEKIFERFIRALPTNSGFGLGLWIVRQITEAHDGKAYVKSELGKGSTFIIELPI